MNLFSQLFLSITLAFYPVTLAVGNRVGDEWHRLTTEIDSLYLEDNLEDAIILARCALVLAVESVGQDHHDYFTSLEILALLHQHNNEYDIAETLFNQSLSKKEILFGSESPRLASILNKLAQLHSELGNQERANQLLLRALSILAYDKNGPSALKIVADYLRSENHAQDLEQFYFSELEIYEKELGAEHLDLLPILNGLASLYENQGRIEEAKKMEARATSIKHKQLAADE